MCLAVNVVVSRYAGDVGGVAVDDRAGLVEEFTGEHELLGGSAGSEVADDEHRVDRPYGVLLALEVFEQVAADGEVNVAGGLAGRTIEVDIGKVEEPAHFDRRYRPALCLCLAACRF
jgi:hypothetical protein